MCVMVCRCCGLTVVSWYICDGVQVLWADSSELVYVCDVCRCCGLTVVSWCMCVMCAGVVG